MVKCKTNNIFRGETTPVFTIELSYKNLSAYVGGFFVFNDS